MPEPALPNHLMIQAILQGVSGLPEDRFVNTWHFRAGDTAEGVTPDDLATAAEMVQGFYNTVRAPHTIAVGGIIGTQVSRASSETRAYDMSVAAPREPVIDPFTLTAVQAGGAPLPNELAICLSFHGAVNGPRTRGRVYVGPLITDTVSTFSGVPYVDNGIRGRIAAAGAAMMVPATGGPVWCIYSRANDNLVTVDGGWVDNAFDVQRRRGVAADARTEF